MAAGHFVQHGRILTQAHAMADALGVAHFQRLANAVRPHRLTGVNGDVQPLVPGVIKDFLELGGGMMHLVTGQIHSHHAAIFASGSGPGHAHGRIHRVATIERNDQAAFDAVVGAGLMHTFQHRIQHSLDAQHFLVLDRIDADLAVNHALAGFFLHHFIGHPLQTLGVIKDKTKWVEFLEESQQILTRAHLNLAL